MSEENNIQIRHENNYDITLKAEKSSNNVSMTISTTDAGVFEKQALAHSISAENNAQITINNVAAAEDILSQCIQAKTDLIQTDYENLTLHEQNVNNPHSVTAEQVNTYTKSQIDNFLDGKQPAGNYLTTHQSLDNYYDKSDIDGKLSLLEYGQASLADVASSGDYNDLVNKPTIPTVPTNISSFTNDSGYTSNTGTVTSVNSTSPDANGNVSLTIPSVDQTFDGTSANAESGVSILGLLQTIYPVGSVYLSTNSTCPLTSLFGTWTLVSSGKALWTGTGSNGNTTIAAGLPNIKGTSHTMATNTQDATGAFYKISSQTTIGGSSTTSYTLGFNAHNYNSMYSDSVSTVQPPAYVVNVWRRTA